MRVRKHGERGGKRRQNGEKGRRETNENQEALGKRKAGGRRKTDLGRKWEME